MKSRQNSGAGLCGCLLFFLMGTFLLGAFFFLNFQIETGPAGDVEFPRADQSNVEQHPDVGDWEMEDMVRLHPNNPRSEQVGPAALLRIPDPSPGIGQWKK